MSFRGIALQLTSICVLVQSNTTVPIPTIIDWSDDSSNAIGSEYIIVEQAMGVQLHQKRPAMSGELQIACIQAISMTIQQIAAIKFPAYGSLYFSDISIDSASKLPLAQGFWVGPHGGTRTSNSGNSCSNPTSYRSTQKKYICIGRRPHYHHRSYRLAII